MTGSGLRAAGGIAAAALALGVAELVSVPVGPGSAPLAALGSTVVDHTPDRIREWAIDTFGTNDKLVLFVSMGVVAIGVAALAGRWERTTRPIGSTLFAAFGIAATLAATNRPTATWTWALPTLIGVAIGITVLRWTIRRCEASEAAPRTSPGGPREKLPTPGDAAGTKATDMGGEAAHAGDAPDAGGWMSGETAEVGGQAGGGAAVAGGETTRAGEARSRGGDGVPGAGGQVAQVGGEAAGAGGGEAVAGGITRVGDVGARAGGGEKDSGARGFGGGVDRRQVVRGIVGVGVLAGVAGVAGRVLGGRVHDVTGERAGVRLPVPEVGGVAVDPAAELRVPGLTPYVTPNSDFYRIDTALVVPQVSTETWSLRIHGMVEREIRLSYADLARRTPVERLVTLTCVSNPVGGDLIGNAHWLGYRLDELLAEAGPHPDADMVLSRSIDGFTAGSPLATLTDGRDALLAVGMNGEPLPVRHGYPARLVVPGLYGYVSATKWVTELEITRFDRAQAYWTKRGWSARGPIKTGTRIDTPRVGARLTAGRVPVAGVAWAQHRGITAVEVQIDDGPWQPARLAAEPSTDTWRQWVYDWDATPGPHTLRARATDGTGEVQTSDLRDVIPDGATGYPDVSVRVA
ncbi:molybdopterin-dependent oxidoreductase [Nocardia blacklockiae]|uniref:molybdopterin-dependent oxidoreductase n=1 Tax=Nocardia blacklockiae TaxID=480036 RepID=UPI00189581AB|nr:molybdopterin-dependent oxidoreductase [Nocardia blacklockiae]MBF6174536.1 molybdopterin-dependent oxidoreductase [Nocardia blacklockiae]